MMIARPLLAVTATALAMSLSACGSDDASATSSNESITCPDGEIKFGVEPFEDPAKLTPAFEKLGEALSEKLDCPVDVQIVQDYSAEVLAMENGKLDLAVFGPLGYVLAADRADAEPIASFGLDDGTLSSYTAGIWVPQDSDVTSIEDLGGHSLALSELGSTSGDGLPREALLDAGFEEGDVDVTYAGGHPEALLALANGKVDAAEINSQQLATSTSEGVFDESEFRAVWTSDPIPNDPITVAGALDQGFKDAVRDALLNLPTEDVEEIGAFLDVDPAGQLVEVDRSTYEPLFTLAATLGLTEDDL